MRGKAARLCLFSFFLGIAPAYAGKRLASAVVPPSSEDHPRVCGEKNVKMLKSKWKLGSPPRMRGKVGVVKLLFELPMDHPRVCGEKLLLYSRYKPCKGSPPRMRGKEYVSQVGKQKRRITPAYAGKSGCYQSPESSYPDHPRVCGEKSCVLLLLCPLPGSPPRMRGKAAPDYRAAQERRITPAYAGKRMVVHHRANGYVGSPPRMRGKARPGHHRRTPRGITPAYAGKSGWPVWIDRRN